MCDGSTTKVFSMKVVGCQNTYYLVALKNPDNEPVRGGGGVDCITIGKPWCIPKELVHNSRICVG